MACDSSYWILESGSLDFSWGNPRGFESHSKQSASLFAAWEVVQRRERGGMSIYTAVREGHKRRKCDQAVDAWRHLPRWTFLTTPSIGLLMIALAILLPLIDVLVYAAVQLTMTYEVSISFQPQDYL